MQGVDLKSFKKVNKKKASEFVWNLKCYLFKIRITIYKRIPSVETSLPLIVLTYSRISQLAGFKSSMTLICEKSHSLSSANLWTVSEVPNKTRAISSLDSEKICKVDKNKSKL